MKVIERNELLHNLMKSEGWQILLEEIDGMIEERRGLLETVNPTMKTVQYDGYDMVRTDIDNLKTLKTLPAKLAVDESIGTVDMSKEV